MQYRLLLPREVRFGWGISSQLGEVAGSLGRRVFLVTGSQTLSESGRLDAASESLDQAGIGVVRVGRISHEPLVSDVDETVAQVREQDPASGDVVVAIGGGAAIDLAKAVSALATNRAGQSVVDYLEGVGRGLTIDGPPLPLVAVPTTAGTGSEATKNAVISCYDPPFKKSLRSDRMVPRAVLIDPELHVTLPSRQTAYSGMDAITQLIESFVSARTNAMVRPLCLEGLRLALPNLKRAVADGKNRDAREAMAQAAFLSGVALANSGLGFAHGVAAALGVHCRVPHGLACAVMLPAAMRINRDARLIDFAAIGRLMQEVTPNGADGPGTSDEQLADFAIAQIDRLCGDVEIPSGLSELGVERSQLADIAASSRGNSMRGNPRELTDNELLAELEAAL